MHPSFYIVHSISSQQVVVEAEICPRIFLCLKDQDNIVCRNAATCIREIAKHTPELAQLIVNNGGHDAIIQYIEKVKGPSRLPGIMTLGYIAAFSETLALAIIVSQGIEPLKNALVHEKEDHVKAAAAWSLGQIGRHTPEHAKFLAQMNVFPLLIDIFNTPENSHDLRLKAQKALKAVLQKCTHLAALEPLLHDCPERIIKYVVGQFAKVLPNHPSARKSFVQSRGLAKIQELKSQDKTKLQDYIATINSCYPAEIVQYYSPNYSETLLKKLDAYNNEQ